MFLETALEFICFAKLGEIPEYRNCFCELETLVLKH